MEKVAIIINTRNREKEYAKVVGNIELYSRGLDYRMITVDDASDELYCKPDYRFKERVGIPKAKNKGMRIAYDWGAGHYFLFDDDCYPVADEWWKPYIDCGQNHLAFTFTSGFEGTKGWAAGHVDNKLNVVVNELSCGCMMYIRRKVLDVVGGMDEQFGLLSKYCDTEWQRRIHNAGLTPYPFMDVVGSDNLLHSMDEHGEVKRGFNEAERDKGLETNRRHYRVVKGLNRYCPF